MKHSKVIAGLAVAVLAVNATLSPSLILADSLTDTSNTSQTQTIEKQKLIIMRTVDVTPVIYSMMKYRQVANIKSEVLALHQGSLILMHQMRNKFS